MDGFKKGVYLIKQLCFLLMIGFLFTACSGETGGEVLEIYRYEEPEGKTYTYQNKNLEFQFNADSTQFYVKDLRNGKTWYSNPTDVENDSIALGDAANALRSTLTLKYTTVSDVSTVMDNFKSCISGKQYTIEPHKDEATGKEIGVDVHYTIGTVEKLFIIPLAVPKSRMDEICQNVSDSDMKSVNNYYQILDINKLRSDQNKNELLEQYPDLDKEPIYILRDNIKEHLKTKLQGIFEAAGYTREDYNADLERYNVSTEINKPAFNITVSYYLDDEDFIVEVPIDQIKYNSKYPIVELSVLPFFGAGGLQDNGFIFVPDGNGGIINFNNKKFNQASYYANVFGWDYGVNRDSLVEETSTSYPLFGISNNGASFLCISEVGSSYAFIEADVSGKVNSYNNGKFTYNMLHREKMDITAKSDTTVQLFEKNLPKEKIKQRYRFLETDGYVDMAVQYRDYLMEKYPTLAKVEDPDVPVAVEYLGAVDTIEQTAGFPVTKPQALTKYQEAKQMTEELLSGGMENMTVKYSGWSNKGVKHTNLNKVKTISRLGSKRDLKDFVEYTKSKDIDLYLDGNFSFVYKKSWLDGFSPNRDAGKRVSRKISKWYTFAYIWYAPMTWQKGESYYFVKPSYTMKQIDNYVKQVANLGVDNISFADIGNILGADYNPKNLVSRETAMTGQQEKLAELKDKGKKVMINSDNEYAIPYADYMLGMNINYSSKNIVDEKVPFYSIVLHGLVPYAGAPMNISQNHELEYLKSIENGAGLYYLFTKADSSVLQDGKFTEYFASDYALWKDTALENYQEYKEVLGGTYNQYITNHEKIENGVYKTEFENGRKVIVNYNNYSFTYNGKTIDAMGYIVEGGGK